MPAESLAHINIRASKALVAELKAFYEGVLGLRDGWRPPFRSTGHWLYLADLPVVHLVEDESLHDISPVHGPVLDHVSFSCTGLPAFVELLERMDIPFRRTTVPATSLVQLIFQDPAGNGVELQFSGDGIPP